MSPASPARRRTGWVAAVLVVWCAACARGAATSTELARYLAIRGALTAADTFPAGRWHAYRAYRVRLESSTGLVATGRLLRPVVGEGPFPAVLLNDGRELNSGAIYHLPPRFGNLVVLSLDYPADLPQHLDPSAMVRRGAALRKSAERIPALFSLGGTYLAQRRDVDSTRLAIAAASFAVPFAAIAAAADDRFRNVALIYGAGDFAQVLAANLTLRPRALRGPVAWLLTRPIVSLEPARFVGRIAPRPLVMVNGVDDPQMPPDAVRQLYDAARAPKALIWLRTGHLLPTDSALIRALVDTAVARLPVLHEGRRGGAGAAPAAPAWR